jgi:hypothetical protein
MSNLTANIPRSQLRALPVRGKGGCVLLCSKNTGRLGRGEPQFYRVGCG